MSNPYPPRAGQNCGNCFYAVVIKPKRISEIEEIECRRSAPQARTGPYFRGAWHYVRADNWCGEWAPMEEPA